MIKQLIAKVVRGENLTEKEMAAAMDEIMTGTATAGQIGAFITALRLKGETVDEIAGAARTMRARANKININNHAVNIDRDEINIEAETIFDIVGTGGDGTRTFNVSTTTAFVAAGGGIKVAKHGTRAVSSLCGSADVLESLDVKLDLTTSDVQNCINEIGIGFLYAPLFHGAMKFAAGPRREIGIRSILNGEKGPKRNMVLLNASAAFVASGVCDNFSDGIEIAVDAIDSGKARKKLDNLIEFTQQCTPYIRKVL